MFIQEEKLEKAFVEPTHKFVGRGTSYKVYLKPEDYEELSNRITDIVLKYFNTAMHNGLNVIINGKKVNSQKLKLPSGKILKGKERKLFEVNKIKLNVLKSKLITSQ